VGFFLLFSILLPGVTTKQASIENLKVEKGKNQPTLPRIAALEMYPQQTTKEVDGQYTVTTQLGSTMNTNRQLRLTQLSNTMSSVHSYSELLLAAYSSLVRGAAEYMLYCTLYGR
jgi:hypothetical protein